MEQTCWCGPTKGRIYGFIVEGSIIDSQLALDILSQGSSPVSNTNENSLEQTETTMG